MIDELQSIMDRLGLDSDRFFQRDVLELVKDPFRDAWTTVYSTHREADGLPSIYCYLADTEARERLLDRVDWPVHAQSFSPGFETSGDSAQFVDCLYPGCTYLVAETYFHPLEQHQLLINNEFVLLFNLYRDNSGNYYEIGESGERQLVIEVGDAVRFKTSYLMRYIAAKQVMFVQLVDSRVSSGGHYPFNAVPLCQDECRSDSHNYKIWFSSTPERDYLFSMLYARSIVDPKPQCTCGVWPYEKKDECYPEFFIREKPDGDEVRFTCNPDKLADYFGRNPGAPHYLTPVFFKPSVLDKYRDNPCFSVSERRLDCGTQWGIEIDNVTPSRVMVYLGDLGTYLPSIERKHFLAYEMSPVGQAISEEVYANDFACMWVDSTGPITRLICARERLNEVWCNALGKRLFREVHADDAGMEKLIRIPSTNGRAEFDTVLINLDKLLVDYIDESALERPDEKGSINKLGKRLADEGVSVDLAPLRDLQSLRSTSTAHAKGSKYDKTKAMLLTGNNAADIEALVCKLTDMMNAIADELGKKQELGW